MDALLKKAGLTVNGVVAQTLALKLDVIEPISEMLAKEEKRRNTALREVERHRKGLGRRARVELRNRRTLKPARVRPTRNPTSNGLVSARQLAANRANARCSTGPRSARGKARSSVNALRYGLSVSARADPGLSEDVENLARRIAEGHPSLLHLARGIADAQADVRRVRQIRSQVIAKALANSGSERRR